MTTRITTFAIAAGVTACAGVGLLFATANESDDIAPIATAGMTAVIDAETGTLRAPTAEEAAQYAPSQRNTAKEPTVVRRADGSESMKLDARFHTYSTVSRDENGNWVQQCSMNHDHALHAATTAPAVSTREVR